MELFTCVTTFLLITLCELGDKTQLATLILASNNPDKRWLIWGAAATALTLCVIVEVTVGTALARYLGPALINRITGVVFLVIGAFTLVRNLGSRREVVERISPDAAA